METSWSQEGPAPAALWGRAEANTFLTSSIMMSPSFSRYYILQVLYLPHNAAISASDPLSVLGLWGCFRGKGRRGKRQGQRKGSKTSAGTHSRDCIVIAVCLGAGIFHIKCPRS